jgi:ketosteroid isomerase-like protein
MPEGDYAAFCALDPFFAVVMEGLSKFVDGEHYFDTLDDDVLFEFRYGFPGWPQVTRGRANSWRSVRDTVTIPGSIAAIR